MSGKATSDNEWIRLAVERYERRLVLYAVHLLGDADRARDVVQDTFLRLWQADRAEIEGHLAPWLYSVCRNRTLDELRKDGRMKTLRNSRPPSTIAATVEHDDTPAEAVRVLDGLPNRQQEALRLKFQGGLSYREIARVMNITVSNVGVLVHTGLKNIREQVSPGESLTGRSS